MKEDSRITDVEVGVTVGCKEGLLDGTDSGRADGL